MRIFGIDPGSARTGFGCVQADGSRYRLVACGAISSPAAIPFPQKLKTIYQELCVLLSKHRPGCVVIENLFHAVNARSALKLGHARGVAMLAAVEAGVPIIEYTPAEVKQAVVGYGRAEKGQVQAMVQLLLGLQSPPTPHAGFGVRGARPRACGLSRSRNARLSLLQLRRRDVAAVGVKICRFAGVAQLVRARGSYPRCPGFKSLHRHHLLVASGQ